MPSPARTTDDTEARDAAIRNATAVLMVDVARADYEFDADEFDSLLRLIQAHFDLSAEDAATLVNAADERVDGLTSLHDFTQLLHNNLDEQEKARVVGLLWQIAYADGRLDKYEDSLVRKISDLLHEREINVVKHRQKRSDDRTRPDEPGPNLVLLGATPVVHEVRHRALARFHSLLEFRLQRQAIERGRIEALVELLVDVQVFVEMTNLGQVQRVAVTQFAGRFKGAVAIEKRLDVVVVGVRQRGTEPGGAQIGPPG